MRVMAATRHLWTDRRARWSPLPSDAQPRNLAEAYAIQLLMRERLVEARGRVAGWKIGLTSHVMQGLFRIDTPVIGAIFEATIYQSPARVRARDFIRLGVDCTLAFKIGRDLPGTEGPYGREVVQSVVTTCAPAIELLEDRGANDYVKVGGLQFTAENAWNGGLVLGPPIPGWDRIDLVRLRGRLRFQGIWVADGFGRDLMGHPLDALTWLANELPKRGGHLRAGDWVATGAMIPTKTMGPGQEAAFFLNRFGSAVVTVL